MPTRSYPARPETPAPVLPVQEPALHLLGGIWIASCPTCGYQLTTAHTQERCEQRASRRRCPVCRGCLSLGHVESGTWVTNPGRRFLAELPASPPLTPRSAVRPA